MKGLYEKEWETNQEELFLNPNHTHFIFVDDGSIGYDEKELDFRSSFEAELRKGKTLKYYTHFNKSFNYLEDEITYIDSSKCSKTKVKAPKQAKKEENSSYDSTPMISILVQGGPSTLTRAAESLKNNIPLLVLAVIFSN